MRERIWIAAGLALFVAIATIPFWSARAFAGHAAMAPDLVLPANAKQCVAPLSYMRASHMRMLMQWREDVVRHNQRQYLAFNGKIYEKSLTHTCLGCHSKAQFCDRCHAYSGVSTPNCWSCHNEPQQSIAGSTP